MPSEYRFDDLDLREEAATAAKADEDAHSGALSCITVCRCTPPPPVN